MLVDGAPCPGRAPIWVALVPLAVAICIGAITVGRSASIAIDSILFVRFARQLAGELPPPDVAARREERADWSRRLALALEPHLHQARVIEGYQQHPGYPMLMALGHRLAERWLPADPLEAWARAGQWTSVLFGGLAAATAALIAARLFGETAGFWTGFALAAVPPFVRTYSDALSDAPALFFMLLATFFACEVLHRGRMRDAAACGLAAALGYWVRPEALNPALGLALVLVFALVVGSNSSRKMTMARLVALVLPVLMICVPYMALRGSPLTKKAHVLLSAAPVEQPKEKTTAAIPSSAERNHADLEPETAGATFASSEPDDSAALTVRDAWLSDHTTRMGRWLLGAARFADAWARDLGLVLVPVVLWGAWYRRRDLWRAAPAFPALLLGMNALLLVGVVFVRCGYLDKRHLLPVAALSLLWLGPGLEGLGAALARSGWSRQIVRVAAGIALLLLVGIGLSHPLNWQSAGRKKAGVWLMETRRPAGIVFDPEYVTAYYAGADEDNPWDQDPKFNWSRLGLLLDRRPDVELVALSDRALRSMGVKIVPTLAGSHRLELIHEVPVSLDPRDPDLVHIYRAVPTDFAYSDD